MFDRVITIPPMSDDALRVIAEQITDDPTMIHNMIGLADGNIGAMNVIKNMYDHDATTASLCLGMLSAFNISGSMLWLLYKDVNGQDVSKMMDMIKNDYQAPKALAALPYSGYE